MKLLFDTHLKTDGNILQKNFSITCANRVKIQLVLHSTGQGHLVKKYWIPVVSSIAAFVLIVLMLGLIKQTSSETLLIDIWDTVKWLTFALVFNFQMPFWLARISVLVLLVLLPLLVFFISKDLLSKLYKDATSEVSE
ncbi:MAG: hypothetical protein ACRC7H_12015 [Plesiomonas shigelloides]